MIKSIVIGFGMLLMLEGCGSEYSSMESPTIAVEPIGAITTREFGEKHLHVHSLQQQLMLLGLKERFKTFFMPDSDDAFVTNAVPEFWMDAIIKAKNNPNISIYGEGIYSKTKVKKLNIRNTKQSDYIALSEHYTTGKVIQGNVMAGKYIVSTDKVVKNIITSLGIYPSEKVKFSYFFDKFYGAAKALQNKDIFFNLDIKRKIFQVEENPFYVTLTPYKRQYLINYMDTMGISYLSDKESRIAINDNFSNWVKAMDKLSKLNKYHNAVYGIHDGRYWFEVADSHYGEAPITIEMIDWIPGGKREYNIYCQGYHSKVVTDKRFYTYYLPDGSKKYFIRFY